MDQGQFPEERRGAFRVGLEILVAQELAPGPCQGRLTMQGRGINPGQIVLERR
jgi:hypothetical protein